MLYGAHLISILQYIAKNKTKKNCNKKKFSRVPLLSSIAIRLFRSFNRRIREITKAFSKFAHQSIIKHAKRLMCWFWWCWTNAMIIQAKKIYETRSKSYYYNTQYSWHFFYSQKNKKWMWFALWCMKNYQTLYW